MHFATIHESLTANSGTGQTGLAVNIVQATAKLQIAQLSALSTGLLKKNVASTEVILIAG